MSARPRTNPDLFAPPITPVLASLLIADLADDRTPAYADAAQWLKATHGLTPREVLPSERERFLAEWIAHLNGRRPS